MFIDLVEEGGRVPLHGSCWLTCSLCKVDGWKWYTDSFIGSVYYYKSGMDATWSPPLLGSNGRNVRVTSPAQEMTAILLQTWFLNLRYEHYFTMVALEKPVDWR